MLEEMRDVVRKAGELALSKRLSRQAHEKGSQDFVTDADLAISTFLSSALPPLAPGSHVLSEEGEAQNGLAGGLFIVDPIDGTTNLMYDFHLSAVSCAYVLDGDIRCAVVYNPFLDEMFYAEKGKGAFLNGTAVHVNGDAALSSALIGAEAGPMTAPTQQSFFQTLEYMNTQGRGVRFTGSAALDLCYVACGRLSGALFDYLFPWDYSAGWLILREAGGRLTRTDGTVPDMIGRSSPLAASNGLIHPELLTAYQETRK